MSILSYRKQVLVLGRGGFGKQLGEMLADTGWGSPVYLDDNAPDCAGTLRDFVDPELQRRCPNAFVAIAPHKRRNMWFNSMIREEPYPGLKVTDDSGNRISLRGRKLGAAWLSSARAVRCRVKSHNERNPYR